MKCPRCKEEMPLLSKVCPVCGYVMEGGENTPSAQEFADRLEIILHEVRALPAPSFMRSMSQLSVWMLPLIALFLLAAAIISDAGIFWIAFAVFAAGSAIAVVLKLLGRLGNDRADGRFAVLKNDFETTVRIARRDFGRNKEVSALLADVSSKIEGIERRRRAASRRNLLVWLAILLGIVLLAAQGVRSVGKAVERSSEAATVAPAADGAAAVPAWREAVERYRKAGIDDYDAAPRQEVLRRILAADEPAEAEAFFRSECMGKVGDYDCAEAIVAYYRAHGDARAAAAFVEGCTLRYQSDKKKLTKSLER